jgi:DNA-binding LytR/AlgR family response regulator
VLGAAATPVIVAISRRFPIRGRAAFVHGLLNIAFGLAVTLALILASCALARLLPRHVPEPFVREAAGQLTANGPLVAAWIAGLTALVHAVRRAPAASTAMAFRQQGRFSRVDLAEVTWIETQGNYLAIHGPSGVRLVRATAKALTADLDPARFVRVHRRAIVAIAAVEAVTPRASGDAELRLSTGETLRVSRSRRARLHEALAAEA